MIVIFAIAHVIFSRSGPGWRAMAIGGSRKSSYNIGINVKRTVCATYVISGVLCGMASVLYAARLGGSGTDTGVGLEISVLTAVVLGGISLGGGRGTVVESHDRRHHRSDAHQRRDPARPQCRLRIDGARHHADLRRARRREMGEAPR